MVKSKVLLKLLVHHCVVSKVLDAAIIDLVSQSLSMGVCAKKRTNYE